MNALRSFLNNYMSRRQVQVAEAIAHMAGEYFARESNRQSLITITRADVSPDLKNATIFFSVLPEKFEESALNFAKRARSDFRTFLKEKLRMKFLPDIDFALDLGEKNRQRIDDLTRQKSN